VCLGTVNMRLDGAHPIDLQGVSYMALSSKNTIGRIAYCVHLAL